MSILLIGTSTDPHVQVIEAALRNLGQKTIHIDFSDDMTAVSYSFSPEVSRIDIQNTVMDNIEAIFWRPAMHNGSAGKLLSIKELCKFQETWNHFLPIDEIKTVKCMNPIASSVQMENKILQLNFAIKCGLHIPNTLISCDKEKITHFIQDNVLCIEKNLGMNWDENDKPTCTRMANIDHLGVHQTFPCIYQEYVKRKREIRVYVVGDTVIPVEIEVDNKQSDIPDWRVCDHTYRSCDITNETREKLLYYHRGANLIYAAYDFIVNERNEEIFLECNPSGKWIFLPTDISDRVTNAVISELLQKRDRSTSTRKVRELC